jgi:hypothetical protein
MIPNFHSQSIQKSVTIQTKIIEHLLENENSSIKELFEKFETNRTRIKRNIELINIDGNYKISIDRTNKQYILNIKKLK